MTTYEKEQFIFFDISKQIVRNDHIDIEVPLICPHCKNTGKQIILTSVAFIGKHDRYSACSITACPYCGSNATNYYDLIELEPTHITTESLRFDLTTTFPQIIKSDDIPALISERYPRFTRIYNQAKQAHEDSLDEIAGMGFRKSIEFLITDFLKDYLPEGVNIEWLENPKTSLSQKIEKLGSERLVTLSKTITYLGNDETHYTRRHEEHDTKSLITFIKPLVSEIENELTYKDAEKFLEK
jgi:hypothetical protein